MWSKETFAVDECGEVIKISESFLAHFKKKKFFLVMTHVELGGGVVTPLVSAVVISASWLVSTVWFLVLCDCD